MRRILKKIFSRFSLVGFIIVLLFLLSFSVSIGILVALYFIIAYYVPVLTPYVYLLLNVVAWLCVVIAVLHCANRDMVPETKLPWLICITTLNLFGVAIYATFSFNRPTRRQRKLYTALEAQFAPYEDRTVSKEELREEIGDWASVSESLFTCNRAAVVRADTKTQFYPSGETFLEALLADLEKAEKYIFLEFFIIARGEMWSRILAVLEAKAQAGVEVRVIYDDIGSMSRVHFRYHKTLQKKGIKCLKFNPFVPVVANFHNNRDHRKIAVIDGKVAYTGGLNIGDEYINKDQPYGHWKDVAVRLEGEGVKNFILLFLRLYDLQAKKQEDVEKYFPEQYEKFEGEGYVQPYGDGPAPLYKRHLGEDVYINILNNAKRYVWISTPYLIIDYRMREALILAARRGVDVRLLTPHIPDKKLAFALTRSNYLALIYGGVKIYEYTPGFVHAKSFIADDETAVVGTINLDYRSFLYHFEDGVMLYGAKAVDQLKADMEETFAVSALQTEEDAKKNVVWRLLCNIAKIFAPLF